jgi:hypothetical protein
MSGTLQGEAAKSCAKDRDFKAVWGRGRNANVTECNQIIPAATTDGRERAALGRTWNRFQAWTGRLRTAPDATVLMT